MVDFNTKLKRAKSLIFSLSEDLDRKPSVVILVFNDRKDCEEVRDMLTVSNYNYKLIIMGEHHDEFMDISIVARHTNEVYNLNKLSFSKQEFELFKRLQPLEGKFVFGTGYFENDQLIFVIEESNNPKFILFTGYEIK